MGWLEGLLTGYADRSTDIRKENAAAAEAATLREAGIYKALLDSPDPKIRATAALGLMQTAQPNKLKGGFGGWLGQMEAHPAYEPLVKYMSTPQPVTVDTTTPGLPSKQTQGFLPQAAVPGQAPMGMPATSPTEGGEMNTPQPLPGSPGNLQPVPPPTPPTGPGPAPPASLAAPPPPPPPELAYHVQDPRTAALTPGPAVGRVDHTTTMQLPHAFPTMEDNEIAAAHAKYEGEYRSWVDIGRRAGQPDPEKWAADQMVQEKLRRSGGGMPYQSLEIEWTDAQGQSHRELGSFDKATNRYFGSQGREIQGTVTKAVPYSALGMGQYVNQAMAEFGVTVDDVRNNPGIANLVVQRSHELQAEGAGATTTARRDAQNAMTWPQAFTAADKELPKATLEEKLALADAFFKGTRAPKAAPGPAAPDQPAPVTPDQQPTPTPDQPTPNPAQAAPVDTTGDVQTVQKPDGTWGLQFTPKAGGAAAPGAAPGAGGPAAAPTTPTTPTAPPAAGAPPAPAQAPVKAPAVAGSGPGAHISAQLPGDLGSKNSQYGKPLEPGLQRLVAQAAATNDLINRALVAMEPFKDDNTFEGTLTLAKNYRQGLFDPIESAVVQMADLAGQQAAGSTALSGGASRSLLAFQERKNHTPRLPSARQEWFRSWHVPASVVDSTSRVIHSNEGVVDSPQQIYGKLQQIKANNDSFIDEMLKQRYPNGAPGSAIIGQPPPKQ